MDRSGSTLDRAVIFDMDGVIVHTNPFHAEAFSQFFRKHRVNFREEDFVEHMYGKHNSYIMSHFFGRPVHGQELLELEIEKEAMFREIYEAKVEAIWGFGDFLKDLKVSGFKTGVATSAPRANLDLVAGKLDLAAQMGSMLASEDVSRHKPDPEVYLKSALRLGVDPAHCVVFEDSFSGVTAAREAGARVVGVLSSHSIQDLPPCDHYIRDYREINVEIVRELIAG